MLKDKINLVLITGVIVALCVMVIYTLAPVVRAQTETTIEIVGKLVDTPVNTITFPEGEASANVSAPYNDVEGVTDPQFLDSAASEPVVRLKNTSAVTLTVWLGITDWTNSVVVSEDYELVDTDNTTVEIVDNVLSTDGKANSVNTGISMDAGTYKALYLQVTLGNVSGKSGTSTLTILGEI